LSGTAPASTSTAVLVFRPARSRASRIAASATASGASPSSANPRSLCTNTWRCCPPPPPGSPTGEQGRRENAGPQAAARTRPARGRRDHQVRAIIPSRRRGLDFVRLIAVNLGQRVAARQGPARSPILTTATPDHLQERIALTDAFIIGLATTRSVLANPPVAKLSRDELSRWAGPVIRQLLVGPAPS